MATPPLPDTACVRVKLDYGDTSSLEAGNRFYLSYSGSAPTAGNAAALAGDIASAWASNLESLFTNNVALKEVDVLDIATYTGLSGQWTGTDTGSRSGTPPPIQCAMNVEFGIARRYRGGKPRIYLPCGADGDMNNAANWSSSFVSEVATKWTAFMTAVEALSIGSMGTLVHVNLSYYQGYRSRETGGGQTTFAPKYRTGAALHDVVSSYAPKQLISSQRRRRSSTTF
jgi:hypothetical protein